METGTGKVGRRNGTYLEGNQNAANTEEISTRQEGLRVEQLCRSREVLGRVHSVVEKGKTLLNNFSPF